MPRKRAQPQPKPQLIKQTLLCVPLWLAFAQIFVCFSFGLMCLRLAFPPAPLYRSVPTSTYQP